VVKAVDDRGIEPVERAPQVALVIAHLCEEAVFERTQGYPGQVDGEHHERELLRLAQGDFVDGHRKGKHFGRRGEEERVQEAEEADAAEVSRGVVALKNIIGSFINWKYSKIGNCGPLAQNRLFTCLLYLMPLPRLGSSKTRNKCGIHAGYSTI
jgi:hypothetical protein